MNEIGKPKTEGSPAKKEGSGKSMLTLCALGVVFGDIGTSPLYAIRQCFTELHQKPVDPAAALGILSLIFWALILVVCVKYLAFIIRADHDGEGGTLAMLALIHTKQPHKPTVPPGALILMVLFGSALLYGDGVITPAISVLSAVEGVKTAAPAAGPYVVPASLVILVGLFLLQSRGTDKVGHLFGPVMAAWFLGIAALGIGGIIQAPQVLAAVNPAAGIAFLAHHGGTGVLVLGAVVLCFTGAEALFADLSHFGRVPIMLGWYGLVLPALMLNYFGQGALMLLHPTQIDDPFFTLVPHVLLWPVVVLATLATVIASQALISGAFSLTQQAIHMGYFPRLEILHTSEKMQGQVYISAVNYGLMIACVVIVLGFRSSENLGGAYGLAVIGTMTITSLTYFVVLRRVRNWPLAGAIGLVGFFLVLDLGFLAGNVEKIISGAWVPLVIGFFVFAIFWIWTDCQSRYRKALDSLGMPLPDFQRLLGETKDRPQGTSIFMTGRHDIVPLIGRNGWLLDHACHEQVLLITVSERPVPYVPENEMSQLDELSPGFFRVSACFGFMQHPDLTEILKAQPADKLKLDWDHLVCYLPEAHVVFKGGWWRQRIQQIYQFMRQNSLAVAQYFRVPPREIIHVGLRLEIK